MKRKYEGFITFLKINAVADVVLGISILIFGLGVLTNGGLENPLLIGAGVGLIAGAGWVWTAVAMIELLSDIEFSIRKPELQPTSVETVNAADFGENPYNRPHALNAAEAQRQRSS